MVDEQDGDAGSDAKHPDAVQADDDVLFAGHTRTLALVGGPSETLETGDVIPLQRADGVLLRCEIVSIRTLSDGTRQAVLWHDLPLDVTYRENNYTHADGRECLWAPERTGHGFWLHQTGGGHKACPRDHWLVVLTNVLPATGA